ncbi:hypothetical protein WT77_00140 [Burkholderia stagnalis]|uniref:DUF2167 domain-containing protein n=1 Tax=Burkholderia stagnalis TaxID=1503054 RepID=UPI00075F9619|nr:DUF2167 domain-containing protein [Burkholderia stagnalis]KWK30496.1 hypothetical protein WT77_00140 [Burkholderia stagnalis]
MRKTVVRIAGVAILACAATSGNAQTAAAQAELNAAEAAANRAIVQGPAEIAIRNEAVLTLPRGERFIPAAEAVRFLRAFGNKFDEHTLVGMVLPAEPKVKWVSVVQFAPSGYIRDDDARQWKPDSLLERMRNGMKESNEGRKARGLQALEIVGWAQPPEYDAATHRLVWSAITRHAGSTADPGNEWANYQTLALGRDGYLALTMVSRLDALPKYKATADDLLAHIDFKDGKRYADFNQSTDHVAAYGLAALIVGVGAKKLGLLAVIGAFAVKFFKVGLVALVAGGVALKRFFGRKPKAAAVPAVAEAVDPERKE